ncbi:hypothetical protein YPPY66_3082 [Yersinia pestis PY-66]|uniref:Uncharacterized protein n=3 Tax=Yersinia pseudotuberculosis complex TaxID=1649845 RepID=A0A0U1QU97_YERP3|nr:hypothetical protein YpsIP31758_1695 [Yersinia pseudotuberculosis IP 31758]ABX87777.1 hypothetical protein YpAngola_A2639 [Yersinia pestis Angola]ADV98677.1 hypothetical protein YPC_2088 [Yersinia pestis biovar Medievalis str. Harbin 35]EDR31192.1 hypothetical protein YPIP275_2400 [Yersinia pestis biovar Orientalis str. IP275]EDR37835.1 hypothetical protein YpF1991016_1076 [Yersinia pestis biovar Orientalis str. F1991016]EDR41594.1 hypothetical protein YpE1979001_2693 [Yersinia pestis biova
MRLFSKKVAIAIRSGKDIAVVSGNKGRPESVTQPPNIF